MTDTYRGDEIEGLRAVGNIIEPDAFAAYLRKVKAKSPHYSTDPIGGLAHFGFDQWQRAKKANRRAEAAEAEIARLRESLAKAEEKSSAWHRLALDVGVERDEARDLALAAESKLAEAKGALALWRDSHLMTEEGAPVDPRQLNSYGGDVVMAASATRATLFHLETQETRHDG